MFLLNLFLINIKGEYYYTIIYLLLVFVSVLQVLSRAKGLTPPVKKTNNKFDKCCNNIIKYNTINNITLVSVCIIFSGTGLTPQKDNNNNNNNKNTIKQKLIKTRITRRIM